MAVEVETDTNEVAVVNERRPQAKWCEACQEDKHNTVVCPLVKAARLAVNTRSKEQSSQKGSQQKKATETSVTFAGSCNKCGQKGHTQKFCSNPDQFNIFNLK